jgi:hypothetical protein
MRPFQLCYTQVRKSEVLFTFYSQPISFSSICHKVSILDRILKSSGKNNCLSLHLVVMDTDADPDRQALDADPDPAQ